MDQKISIFLNRLSEAVSIWAAKLETLGHYSVGVVNGLSETVNTIGIFLLRIFRLLR